MASETRTREDGREEAKCLIKKIGQHIIKEAKRKKKIVKKLRKFGDELDIKQRDMNIANVSFASSGVVGTGLTIAGIIAAPFTFGVSLGFTIAGISVGVASGLGGLATSIADWIINNNTLKEAQAIVNDYQETINSLMDLLQQLKSTDVANFKELVSEEVANMPLTERHHFECVLNGVKTGAEMFSCTGRSVALAGAVAARTGAAVGRTMMETLETGMKTIKIGGLVLSVLTVPLDVYTMVTNSVKIHKKTPSKTAVEIRKLADHLEKYSMVSTHQGPDGDSTRQMGELEALRRDIQHALPDIVQMEQLDEENQESQRKLKEHLKRIVDKIPTGLDELASRHDRSQRIVNIIKSLCCVLQLFGTSLVAAGLVLMVLGQMYHTLCVCGVWLVIACGILLLVLEMVSEIATSSIWRDAEIELERYFHTMQVLTDLNQTDPEDHSQLVEDTFNVFRDNLHKGRYIRKTRLDLALITSKLVIDTLALVLFNNTSDAFDVPGVVPGIRPLDTSLSLLAYPVILFTGVQINAWSALIYLLSAPVSVVLLYTRWEELHGTAKSKVTEAMHNLAEDFCIRFQE